MVKKRPNRIRNEKIKTNVNFLDDNQKFSRTKYEKFLISNNLNANEFEKNFKNTYEVVSKFYLFTFRPRFFFVKFVKFLKIKFFFKNNFPKI